MTIGLAGLGNMGLHFAARLLAAGQGLVVYDVDEGRLSQVAALGGRASASLQDLASQAETIFLSLPMPGIVKQAAIGKGNIIAGTAVRTLVDLSTTGPAVTKDIAALLAERNIAFVSAPVSGGTQAAEKGTLAIMAAGNAAAYREIEPVLRHLGKNIFYLGADPSLGQTMKILNNTLYAASMVASAEALVYGVKAGLNPQMMLDVINVSSGRSYATMERIPQSVLDRSFPVRFTTELLLKDVKMCIEDAERIGAPMAICPSVRQFLAFAISQGDGAKDNAQIIRHFEAWAGVQFGAAPSAE